MLDCDPYEKTQKAGDLPMTHVSIGSACIDTSSSPYSQSTGRASLGRRLLGALTAHVGVSRALAGIAILAALAVGLLLSSAGPLQAQVTADDYPENGTGAAATLTAVDPEGKPIVWTLAAGDDVEDFSIKDGVLSFKSAPDFETPRGSGSPATTYVVTVEASDGGDETTAMEKVTIKVTNVEEPGTVMLSTLQPQIGVPITATLDDPDVATASTVTWQWYRGNSEIAGATDGAGAIISSYTPATGDIGSVLRATAMYDDGEDEDKTAQEDSAYAVREAPESNVPPTFPNQDPGGSATTDQTREVAENTPADTNLGAPVVASDPDVLTYSLDDAGAMSFDINRATGQLTTKVALNFEGSTPAPVTVTATDPFGATDMSIVTITVTDVNEDPSVTGDASIDHAESNDTAVTVTLLVADPEVYTASDVDTADLDADLTWVLSGADASKFEFASPASGATRILAFKANPDFESPGDSGGDNVYEVTLVVTDSKDNTDEQDVTVKVTNIEEAGVVTLSTLQPRVSFPVTATLTDPDNIIADSVSWQWYRGTYAPADDLPDTECADDADECLIKDAASDTYTPVADDIGAGATTLTAVATYTDGNANVDDAKDVATGVAANPVLADTRNKAPVFPDQDTELDGRQTAQERMIAENTEADVDIGVPVVATDEDTAAQGGVLTYSLGGPDAASFGIVRTSGQLQTKAALDTETKGSYTVTVTAADSLSESSTITVTIKVTNMDEMPDLEGEAPEKYAENGTGAVATFRATDPEGESIVWSLAGGNMDDFTIVNGVLRFNSSPDYEDSSNTSHMYTVTVQASDGGATPATEEVTIEVTNVEESGTVTLSTLQPQVERVITATLTDPDVAITDTITWQWYRGSSPIAGANDGENSNESMYTPVTGDIGGRLRARAMYDDGEGEDKTAQEDSANSVRRAPDTNTDPVFPDQNLNTEDVQTEQTREVAENTPAGRNLGPRAKATDPGDILTYSLDAGIDAAAFDINRATGQLTTKAALDFEMAVDQGTNNEYEVTVTAADPFGATATSVVTITVTDVNEAPSVSGAASIDHAENGTVLDIDAETGNVQAADYTATDEDVDDDPAELTWLLSGADASKFDITTTGDRRTLSFKEAPDYESPGDSGRNNVYDVTVKVTDSKGNSDEQDVTVKVTNVEEPGEITLSTLQPRVGFPVTATLADADNITAGSLSWQWYKGNVTQEGLGTLDMTECVEATTNGCFIKGAASDTYTPVADDVQDTLVAVALYTDGSPNEEADAKDFAMMVTAQPVLADTRNKAPVFPDQDEEMEGDQTDQMRMVGENVPVIGTAPATILVRIIGLPVVAMDFIIAPADGTETPEILTYTLGGPDADSFSIDRGTAQLSTKVALDYETKGTYTVTVTATDPSGLQATITVTITVINVDEAPEITVGGLAISGMAGVDYAENGTMPVATYTAAGPDADMAVWTLSGDDAGDFDIAGGELTFERAPDFESPADADTDNEYQVTVEAYDGTSMDTQDVTVTVTNVDEAPDVAGEASIDYEENATSTVETYTAVDPEGAEIVWSLGGDDAALLSIEGGVLSFRSAPDFEMPADADTDNEYQVTVVAGDGTNMDTQDVTVTVTDVDEATVGDTLVDRYDTNNNGTIEKSEVLKAINDYLFGEGDEAISKTDVLKLINIYLFGE